MNERKINRAISLLLIPCLLITSLFISASPTTAVTFEDSEAPTNTTADVTLEDVLAGAADPSDLYGELDASTVPDAVGLETAKSRGHVRRMYSEEGESLYNVVFQNADGTRTLYLFSHPVKYVDTHGEIRDISLEIADSSLSTASFETAAGLTTTRFASKLSDGITLSGSDASITLVPVLPQTPSAGTNMSATEMSTSAATRIDGKTVSYVYGDKTTIEYSLTYTGFKEDIVVSEYTGQTEYDFRLQTNGLALTEMDGSYYLVDEDDTVKATIGDIIIFTADNRNNALGSIVAEEIKANQEYLLTIVVDEEYLSDPDTAYPIRIDPTIELTYALSGAGVIEDVTLNSLAGSAGSSTSLGVGKRGTYGISRILMKFPGLDLSGIASASAINSATVELRDLMCESTAMELYCHIFTGNTWTEATATWSNVGASSYISTPMSQNTISYANGAAQASDHRYPFDITTAVRGWKSNSYVQDEGIIFKASSSVENGGTNLYKTFGSYNRGSYEPRLYVTYTVPPSSLSLNYSSISIAEGGTRTLVASTNPSGQSVSWSTNNSTVATVSSSGVVTAKKAGTATITARMTGSDGISRTASCTVYVYIANGVYYIQNLNSNYYLHVESGKIANYSDVYQYSKYSTNTPDIYKIRQMWKIYYLGNGRYSVRPMHKLNMGLDVTSGNVDIYNIGTSDMLSSIPSCGEWTIEWYSTGYIFKNNGSSSQTMQVKESSTSICSTIIASTYSTSLNCRWSLSPISSPPTGAYWYDTVNGTVFSGTSDVTKSTICGSSVTAENLGLTAISYSPSSVNQTFTWTSGKQNVASVNASTGLITAKEVDVVVITATTANGMNKVQFNLEIKSTDPFHFGNIEYLRYTRITDSNWWGLGSETDHTISIVKSTQYLEDYCIVHDNINEGNYRTILISDELKTTLNNLEDGYQAHHNIVPSLNSTTEQEDAAHAAKEGTDQLVEEGYFSKNSSEYYGVWAYNYVSLLNLLDYWKGAIDTATAAYGVYMSITSFYYSYLTTINTTAMQVTSSQYASASSVIDDIDDAMNGMSYGNRTVLSADSRNISLAQQGYTNPLPYEPQTPVVQYQQTGSTQYVRVFTDGNKAGKWLMQYSDIQGLTPAQIQSKFALPNTPTHYCFVNVPAGTTVYVGVVNQSSISGTLQYELGTMIPESSFGTSILLP